MDETGWAEAGEYAKPFRGLEGHTMRYKFVYQRSHMKLERHFYNNYQSDQNQKEYPVTEIDGYFDPSFSMKPLYGSSKERPLNTVDKWENVVEKLHELATQTETYFDPSVDGCIQVFKVPIIGSWAYAQETLQAAVKRTWFCYKGKYYDPTWIYQVVYRNGSPIPHSLKPICPRDAKTVQCDADIDAGQSTESKELAFYHILDNDMHHGCFEIDLGIWCRVDRLVTFGAIPQELETFPSWKAKATRGTDRKRWRDAHRQRNTGHSRVSVLSSRSKLCWTSSYTVEYRLQSTGKWAKYPFVLPGNVDTSTAKSNSVDFVTRYLRITPQTWQEEPEMRIKVFGNAVEKIKESVSTEAASIPTVTYKLIPEQRSNLTRWGHSYSDSWVKKERLQARQKTRRYHQSLIRETQDSLHC